MTASPPLLELELHGVHCRLALQDGLLGDRLRALYGHAESAAAKAPDLVVTVCVGGAAPNRPEAPTFSLIADRIIWGDLVEGRLVVSDGRSWAHVDYATGQAVLTLTEHNYAAEYVATNRLFPIALSELLRTRGVYYVHAAAVAGTEGAAIFVGDSEAGKSTLAYCAMRDGLQFIADDGLLLAFSDDGVPYVEPFYREFALDQSTMTPEDRARAVPCEPMHTGDPRSRLVPEASRCAARARVNAVLGLERTEGASAVLGASRTELLGELLRQNPLVALHPELASPHLGALRRLVAHARLGVVQSGPDVIGKLGSTLPLLDEWTRPNAK